MKDGFDSTATQEDGVAGDLSRERQALSPFGPFRIAHRIASGGSSEVVLAVDERPERAGRSIALKRPLPGRGGASALRRLEREARLLHAAAHENVVAADGVGRVEETPYLCLEYVDGVDLYRLMQRVERERRAFPQAAAVYLARCVANALMAVHSASAPGGRPLDIVHADVSPSNILLSLDGQVKLADFGTARALADPDGHTGLEEASSQVARAVPHGKLGYLAPEQVRGEAVDHRADLFALGVILSELLMGRRLFAGSNRLSVLLSIRDGDVAPLWGARAMLPEPLFEICSRALQLNPSDRQSGAAELSAELCGLCDEELGRRELSQWVRWAGDSRAVVARLRHSVSVVSGARRLKPAADSEHSSVRRASGEVIANLSLDGVVQLASRGELLPSDEVSLAGLPYRLASSVAELSPYVATSTSEATGQLYEPGVPDFTADVAEVPMAQILGRLRERQETGLLFVCRERAGAGQERLEVTLMAGRVQRVTKQGTLELALRKLAARGHISEAALAAAQAAHELQGGDVLALLMARPEVDSGRLVRLLRNQARDRLAATCMWPSGRVMLYRSHDTPAPTEQLQLDLSVPLLVGALSLVRRGDDPLELAQDAVLVRGLRGGALSADEAAGIPKVLLAVHEHVVHPITLRALVEILTAPGTTAFDDHEVRAALAVALQLGWAQVLASAG